ncbi:MAG TPA: MYXO-CTERM sorting domain-containing protein [Polyangia bacterium]|nr:MYXO-CTERM sorting domain-containing protein [Polyangia bacterium]
MSFKRLSLGLGFLAVALAAPAARAQDCNTTTDCQKGFTCEIVPVAPPPVAQPEPACKEGSVCPVTDVANAGTTATTPASAGTCVEADCKVDDDCGTGMVCHSESYQACSGGTATTCPADVPDCKPITVSDPVCTTTKVSKCTYKWQLPCNVDNDCGDGFTCAPTIIGYCSGSGGTPVAAGTSGSTSPGNSGSGGSATSGGASGSGGSSGSMAPSSGDSMCGTMTSFPGTCTPKATTCGVDADCPAAWTCQTVYYRTADPGTTVSSPPTTGGASASGGASGGTTASSPPSTTTPATKACVSPFGGGYGIGETAGGKGDTTSTPPTGAGGSVGTVNNGGTTPTTPGATNGPTGSGNTGTATDASSTPPSAGCAVGGGAGRSSAGLLLLGALGLLIARRRR